MSAPDFETRRFQSAAAEYLAGRPPYPVALVRRVVQLVPIGPGDRLIDLACGPANLACAFAPFAREIVAIDPEPAMLAIARAQTRSVAGITVCEGSSESFSVAFGLARAVLIGRAFHWMDRADLLARCDTVVQREGAVVLFDDDWPAWAKPDWRREYDTVLEEFGAADPRRAHLSSDAYPPHAALLAGSAFSVIESIQLLVPNRVSRASLVARALSFSSTSVARLGERAAAMVSRIESVVPKGELTELVSWTATIARRPHDAPG